MVALIEIRGLQFLQRENNRLLDPVFSFGLFLFVCLFFFLRSVESSQPSPSATLTKTTFYIKSNTSYVNAIRLLVFFCIPREFVPIECDFEKFYTYAVCFKENCAELKNTPFILHIALPQVVDVNGEVLNCPS